MADVIMPQMGESIAEGTITKWLKRPGEPIQRDEPLFEISTDKVDAEIPAPASGFLKTILFEPGATVPINTVVAVISAEPEAFAPPLPLRTAPPPDTTVPAAPLFIGPDEPLQLVTPAPAAPTVAPTPLPSPVLAAPPIPKPAPSMPPLIPPPLLRPPAAPSLATPAVPARSEMSVEQLRQTRSSPVVRKIAAEHGVDVLQIEGSGISGRVTKQDILAHLVGSPTEASTTTQPPPPTVTPPSPPEPATPPATPARGGERVQLVPMSPIRKKTAEHMVLSKRISAHVHTIFEIDMSRVEQLRTKYRPAYQERNGVHLTYLPFILKATVDALKAFPILNCSVDGDSIVYKKDINIGIAVALDWGLIVPVIRNADEKNVLGLARTINDLAERARTKKLRVDEVQGGTFTITNPGVFGSLFGTPIINQPQVAILGVGVIEKRPIVRDDAIAIRLMAHFALTFDHRIVDGSAADQFMAHVKKGLQEFDESAL